NFTIGIKQISSEIPDGFALLQNYPNPFNPVTKIKFNIPLTSNVSIRIFDIQGRVITTLVNDKLNGGTYETEWNAINTSSGVYFYRIESGNYTETKKMILVK
ncbi:MAG TPA: T9SS type A sorting domain-containing protein, partial [Ignavibacteria bacterium]|nr:T9SS type A sorting domain-containing protein [Ignavibacteria bacterium]